MFERRAAALLGLGLSACTWTTPLDHLSSGEAIEGGGGGGSGGEGDASGGNGTVLSALPRGGAADGGSGGWTGEAPCGAGAATADGYAGLRLNEIAPNGAPDWIELVNIGPAPVELACCMIAEETTGDALPASPEDIAVLPQTTLLPGQRYVAHPPFGIDKDGPESFALFDPSANALDTTSYIASSSSPFDGDEVWARMPDAVGPFTRIKGPSPGSPNQ